jgi:FAD synthetase
MGKVETWCLMSIIAEANFFWNSFESLALSFNGGKDCTVLLHLVAAVMSRLGYGQELIRTVFVTYPNPFPHVDAFVKVCIQRYQLKCVYIPGPMKQALQQYLDGSVSTKAIFVGIRRTDPYAGNYIQRESEKRGIDHDY